MNTEETTEVTNELLKPLILTLEKSVCTLSKIEDHRHKEATQTKIILTGLSALFLILCYLT